MHETLFFICGGILAASAVIVSFIGLKNDDFPGKLMPVIIIWFAIFACGAGTFAVLHGKDESKEHDPEYKKASEEITKAETSGPYEEALKEEQEAEAEEEGGGEEGGAMEEGGEEDEGGESMEGESEGGEEAMAEGNAEAGEAVFSENCSVCHGSDGHGGNGGPDLTTMPKAQEIASAEEQVTNGGGGMPPFGGTLSGEEISNVAAYVVHDVVGK
jgi:cytochrome c553